MRGVIRVLRDVLHLDREKDPDVLRQAAQLLERENQRLTAKVVELTRQLLAAQGKDVAGLQLRLAELEQQLAQRNKALFAPSSEKRKKQKTGEGERATQTGHGPRPQPTLPIVEKVHTLDDADKACAACGGTLTEWAGQAETRDEIDVVERRFVVTRHVRTKYRCACGGCVETAPVPVTLCEGGRYSTDFAIEVATSKYVDHAPLERQVRTMAREGLVVDSQTLWDQLERLARALAPTADALGAHVRSQPVVFADETRWRLMGPKGQDAGEASRWQVWVVACDDAVSYRIQDSRSMEAARVVLGEYAGVVVCDGYRVYSALAKQQPGLRLAHCWAHVRRKFLDVEPFFPTEVSAIVGLIGELYAIEQSCPPGREGDTLRRELRRARARDVLTRIQQWALDVVTTPESALGKAIAYMAGLWSGLTTFLENPRVPLDNNGAERAVRGPVVGRKNHYGSRSQRGTEVAALFYTLVESAKLCGVEPKAYLRRATEAALGGGPVVLPHTLRA
jgi:transposase